MKAPKYVNQVLRAEGKIAAAVKAEIAQGKKGDELRAAVVKALGNALRPDRIPEWVVLDSELVVHLANPFFRAKKLPEAEFYGSDRSDKLLLYFGEGVGQRGDDQVRDLGKKRKLEEVEAWSTAAGEYMIIDIEWRDPLPALAEYDRLVEEASEALDAEVLPPYER